MILKTKIRLKSKYKASSKHQFWKKLIAGDVLYICLKVGRQNRNKSALKAVRLKVIDSENNEFNCTITELCNYLDRVEYEDLEEIFNEC